MSKPKPTLPTSVAGKAPAAPAPAPAPRGPNRSTKASQKLKVLPDEPEPVPTQSKALKSEKAPGEEDDSDDDDEPEEEEEDDVQVYKQLAQIPAGSARRDAMRLTRKEKARLPRVTAFCTATSYRLGGVFDHLKARQASHLTSPIKFDEVIYTPYSLPLPPSPSPSASAAGGHSSSGFGSPSGRGGSSLNPARHLVGKLVDIVEEAAAAAANGEAPAGADGAAANPAVEGEAGEVKPKKVRKPRFAIESEQSSDEASASAAQQGAFSLEHSSSAGNGQAGAKRTKAEVFVFDYGVCVIWGMTEEQERRFLSSLRKYEVERLAADDIEVEDLVYYYASYSRVFNDVIALKKGSSYMTKLSLSHALAQSVKLSFFEAAVGTTIDQTKGIPQSIIESGKIQMSRKEIMKQIGRLFLLRVNISLVGSMIDSPELFWTFPDLEPLYGAFKTYLEIPQRLNVITGRVDVLQDMLRLLKESVNSAHGEGLELIVVWLIVLEIVLGVITIMVDLFS